jgi:F-type H+-transporting ATPase subunit beta
MDYWTYENWRARGHKAVVHLGTCRFCNQGQGLSGGTRQDNGKWHGPFDSLEKAKAAVPGIRPTTDRCVR